MRYINIFSKKLVTVITRTKENVQYIKDIPVILKDGMGEDQEIIYEFVKPVKHFDNAHVTVRHYNKVNNLSLI